MKIGIASDHGGFKVYQELKEKLTGLGHVIVDFGNTQYNPDDDFPIMLYLWPGRLQNIAWKGELPSAEAVLGHPLRPIKCHWSGQPSYTIFGRPDKALKTMI